MGIFFAFPEEGQTRMQPERKESSVRLFLVHLFFTLYKPSIQKVLSGYFAWSGP